jgi:ABC-2 type transport system permease protein
MTWFYLTYSFFVLYLGGMLQFPKLMGTLLPFGYNPQIPIEDMEYTKVSVLTIIAAILIVDGFMGY